ncbi:hypothetical protein ACFLT9_00320 [Acidobacteriota bacterium]
MFIRNNIILRKGTLLRLSLFLLLVLLVINIGYGQVDQTEKPRGFFLRSGGGVAYLGGGDFGDMIKINGNNFPEFSDVRGTSYFKSFGGEIGYDLGRVMVGFESGFISRSFDVVVDDGLYHGPWEHRFSAVPLLLNMYIRMLNTKNWRSYLLLGGGLYVGKYRETWNWDYLPVEGEKQTGWEESKATRPGYHFGGTSEFQFNNLISVFVEARFVFAPFRLLRGKRHYSYSLMKYEEDYEGDLNYLFQETLSGFYIGDDYSPYLNQSRKAELDFKGWTFSLGVKLHL